LQEGVRVKLPPGTTWEQLAAMTRRDPRPGSMAERLPAVAASPSRSRRVRHSTERDRPDQAPGRARPDPLRYRFRSARTIPRSLSTGDVSRSAPDLGDVSQGKLITISNYFEMFNGIITPRQLEGLRLLVTPFPEQQFNATDDRKSALPSLGASCFDCHANGHQDGTTHLAPDARPEWFRHRLKTVSLRGVDIQRLSARSAP